MMSYNQLTRARGYEFYRLMEQNKAEALKRTDQQNAEWATEKLYFPVSAANVAAARADLGWGKRRVRVDSAQTAQQLSDRISRIERYLDCHFRGWDVS
jgi:hypothetical protein